MRTWRDGAKQMQALRVAAKEPGLVKQTLRNWVKASAAGKLTTPGTKPVTPAQMELSRLRAENARLKMHVDILKNRPRGLPRPIWIETCSQSRLLGRWTKAACFLEAFVPVKKPGPGEAADPTVVAPRVTSFRKLI